MSSLPEHLETFLGTMNAGWQGSDVPWGFQIARFSNYPIADTNTYVTTGLSHVELTQPGSTDKIRQELMIMARSSFGDATIPDVLRQIAAEALSHRRAYLQGEVIGPRNKLFSGKVEMSAFFVTHPVYLPDEFAYYESPHGFDCVIAWLVPITSSEAKFVLDFGWPEFERILSDQDPDLLDLNRQSVV